jgi:hypothetical protein
MNRKTILATALALLAGSLLAGTGCASAALADTHLDPKAPQGSIGGRIQFPAGVAPAMRICAISAQASQCIDSPAGRTLYRIGNLPDGDYQVVARLDGATPVAGHVQQVQCIRAPCQDQLATLSVAGGKEVATADLNGFYAERTDFPALPDAVAAAPATK